MSPAGRPPRPYSRDIAASWEVVQKMMVTVIPVRGGMWFALAGNE